jgi:hypothetical protein
LGFATSWDHLVVPGNTLHVGGWLKTLIDPIDMGLMGIGIALIISTTIGLAQGK